LYIEPEIEKYLNQLTTLNQILKSFYKLNGLDFQAFFYILK
jgi:hypothetical protein